MKLKGIINYKTYPEATGKKGLELSKHIDKFGKGILGIAPQHSDLAVVCEKIKAPVFAQHVDAIQAGRNTGYVTPYSIKRIGCSGTLLDHSEHLMKEAILKKTMKLCRKEGLKVILCADDTRQLKLHLKLKPDVIVYEPPELIATGKSVSKAKPSVLKKTIALANKAKIPVWCGAGISSVEDVKIAGELGAEGVLIASWVVKNRNKKKTVQNLVKALKKM